MKYSEISVGVNNAKLYAYLLDENISTDTTKKWPCVIVVPGGGYLFASTKEGESVATKFFGAGYSCFILRYNTKIKNRLTREMNEGFAYPNPSVELIEALHIIRQNAEQWHIDVDNIYLNGYSAGAHVILTALLRNNESFIADKLSFPPSKELDVKGLILGYPMLTLEKMNPIFKEVLTGKMEPTEEEMRPFDMAGYLKEGMCPMFIWQTAGDDVVYPTATCRFVGKGLDLGNEIEFHLFENGPHGLAMADERYAKVPEDINPEVATWFGMALSWMKKHNEKRL